MLILDDRYDVWADHLENLLLVPPYYGSADGPSALRSFSYPCPSLAPCIDLATDRFLDYVLPILTDVRAEFLRLRSSGEAHPDVRKILDRRRREVLQGTNSASILLIVLCGGD